MGGAAGHMKHPFDLPAVETGEDLKQFFETAADWVIENTAVLKIDGVNASFKLIDSPDAVNGKEFALDRGSAKPIDIEGITTSRVGERWPPEHGMHAATIILLDIFNKALWHEAGAHITEELQQLGLWDDPTKIFNAEFVLKHLNVKEYKTNFIALHGINKFDWVTKKRRASKEIPYEKDVLESIRDKVAPFAKAAKDLTRERNNLDMEVYTSVPIESLRDDGGAPIRADFSKTLNSVFPIHQRYGEPPVERSLDDWLSGADNPRDAKVPLVTGRKPGALSKEIYKIVLNTTEPLADLLGDDEEYIKLARDGAIFWHATRLLGHDVLSTLTAGEDFGPVNDEEGIVLRDTIAFGTEDPVKITGNFILKGEEGRLAKKSRPQKVVGIFPGSFKPPHYGHFTVLQFLKEQGAQEIKVLVSAPEQEVRSQKITPAKAKAVWEEYLEVEPVGVPVDIIVSSSPSPIGAAYDYIEKLAPAGETILLGTSEADAERYPQETLDQSAAKNPSGNVKVQAAVAPACKPPEGCDTVSKMSAGVMRDIIEKHPDVSQEETQLVLNHMHPSLSDEKKMDIFSFLVGAGVKKTEEPASLSSMDEPIEEVSAMGAVGGGSVEGFSGTAINKRKHIRREATNYQYMTKSEKRKMLKEEQALRKHIRALIKKKHQKQINEEQQIRGFVRKLIKEVKIEDSPTKSTGINKLISVLKIIFPTIERAYKSLTTDKEQRISFKKHLVHAVINTLSPQDAIDSALDEPSGAMAESLLKEQELAPDPTKFIDIGIRTDKEKEEEEVEAAADKEAEDKIAKEEEVETKKKDLEAFEDISGEKRPFPEIAGLDLTGRDDAVETYKRVIDAIIRGYGKLHNETDEAHFKDYLVTNTLLYMDKWEDDIATELPDLTTPEYETAKGEKEKYTGAGEEGLPPPEEGFPPPDEEEELAPGPEALGEKIEQAIMSVLINS